jgi:hypothetical protein
MAIGLYLLSLRLEFTGLLQYATHTVLLLIYVGIAYLMEKPKKALI